MRLYVMRKATKRFAAYCIDAWIEFPQLEAVVPISRYRARLSQKRLSAG